MRPLNVIISAITTEFSRYFIIIPATIVQTTRINAFLFSATQLCRVRTRGDVLFRRMSSGVERMKNYCDRGKHSQPTLMEITAILKNSTKNTRISCRYLQWWSLCHILHGQSCNMILTVRINLLTRENMQSLEKMYWVPTRRKYKLVLLRIFYQC